MSKANIEKIIEEILSNEQRLSEFLACEDQDDLYRYCLERSSGYTREEFDKFIEETISKANCEAILNEEIINSLDYDKKISSSDFDKEVSYLDFDKVINSLDSNKEINQNSDGGAKASFGKKIRQAFTKVIAAGLAVFSAVPAVQNLIPSAAQAIETVESVDKKSNKEKVVNRDSKNQKETKSIGRTKSINSGKEDKPNNGESKLVGNRRINNKAKTRKLSLNKIMPWLLGTSAAAVTTYAVCRFIKHFLSNSPEELKEEENDSKDTDGPKLNQKGSLDTSKKTNSGKSTSTPESTNNSKDKKENSNTETSELSHKDNPNSGEQQPIIESVDNSNQEKTLTLEPTNDPEPAILGSDIKINQEEDNEYLDLLGFFEKVEEENQITSNSCEKPKEEKDNENPNTSDLNSNIPINNPTEEPTPGPESEIERKPANNVAPQKPCFDKEYLIKFLDNHLPDVTIDRGYRDSIDGAKQTHASIQEATDILTKATSIFENIPKVAEIEGPITVTSDFHGSSGEARDSILDWLNKLGTPEETHYLNLGDSLSRSLWEMETFLALVILKCTYPERVTLLKGNHEDVREEVFVLGRFVQNQPVERNEKVKLSEELKTSGLSETFWNIVERLSLIAEVTVGGKRILCNHAAVPHDGYHKEKYSNIHGRISIIDPVPEKTKDYRYDALRGIFWDDYDSKDGVRGGRGMCVGLESYEKVMEEAKFDYAISGHEHTNIPPIISVNYPLYKVCSQPYNDNRAHMLIVRPNGLDVSFTRKEYNESKQWVEITEN